MMLETPGHQVFVKDSGAGGLAAASRYKPDIVFLDIGLPQLDGHKVVRRVRAASETSASMLVALAR